ncbi:MAG: uroporphyrinogen decarboxylase family protein [Candidatus Bathyarchaeia archaeon]
MKNKERFLTAVRGETPDIVPVAPLIHNRFACKLLGRVGWKAVFEIHQMIGSIWFRGPLGIHFNVEWPHGWGEKTRLIEEMGTRKVYEHVIETPYGNLVSKVIYGIIPSDPALQRTVEYYIKTEDDYKVYNLYLEEFLRRAKTDISEAIEAYNTIGDEGVPNVGTSCAFSHLCQIRGPENLLIDLYRRTKVVKETLKLLQEIKEKEVEAFIEAPSEVLYYDVWGAYDMSPKHFREVILPDLMSITDKVRKANKYVGFYMVGKIRELLPIALEAKPHFIEPFERQSNMTLEEAKKLYGKKVCLMGNFDPVILAFGNKEEAEKEALRCLKEGMEGGGYVLVTGDEVPANAKIENLRMMVKTVEKYGRY